MSVSEYGQTPRENATVSRCYEEKDQVMVRDRDEPRQRDGVLRTLPSLSRTLDCHSRLGAIYSGPRHRVGVHKLTYKYKILTTTIRVDQETSSHRPNPKLMALLSPPLRPAAAPPSSVRL
jgi:hypothetical protein